MSFEFEPGSLFWLPTPDRDWKQSLARSLEDDPTGRLLRGVCSHQLGVSQLRAVRAAMVAAAEAGAGLSALRRIRVGLIGSGTLDFLADALGGTGPRFGLRIDVAPVHYDAIATAAFADPGFEEAVDVVVVAPDAEMFRRPEILLDGEVHAAAVREALAKLDHLVTALGDRLNCPVVLATVPPRPDETVTLGDRAIFGSYGRFVADINTGIANLTTERRLGFWDIEQAAAHTGYRLWRDPVALHVAKSPFAISLAPLLADRLCAALAPLFGKSRRALVLDLDNTLWGGVVGDDGLAGIVIGQGDAVGEAHLSLQKHILELRRRGVVLAVLSKNDDAVAREPFRDHPDMILREEHFAVFQANWTDKATNLKAIAEALNLDPDALVFLDDNPAERARVRQAFPEVAVAELPEDPALFATYLAAGGYFESVSLNADDLARADAYRDNARRAEIRRTVGSYEDYLDSLDMVLTVSPFDLVGRGRIAQLINKSNQFNLTTRRRQEADVEDVERAAHQIGLQVRLTDTFGDNGMISVVILEKAGETVHIDTWLMSCRVLEREVEKAVLNEIVSVARALGATRLVGEYLPTARNGMVRDHYRKLGFSRLDDEGGDSGPVKWVLKIEDFQPLPVRITTKTLTTAHS